MEARDGIEPTYEGFADPRITTLLSGHILMYYILISYIVNRYKYPYALLAITNNN